jgi:hypothetical protein
MSLTVAALDAGEGRMACADYQKLRDDEQKAEAELRGLKFSATNSVREDLHTRVAAANAEIMRHIASCPEMRQRDGRNNG